MKTYERHTKYEVDFDGQATAIVFSRSINLQGVEQNIPEKPGNRHYDEMMTEIADGDAELIEVDDTVLPDYAAMRRRAYAPTGDQLDMQYHDSQDGTTTWVDHVQSVKNTHPKPE